MAPHRHPPPIALRLVRGRCTRRCFGCRNLVLTAKAIAISVPRQAAMPWTAGESLLRIWRELLELLIHTGCVLVWLGGARRRTFCRKSRGVADRRRNYATRNSLDETLKIGLLSTVCGSEGCTGKARFGRKKEPFLRGFMQLEHGIPSDDGCSGLINALDPADVQAVLLRLVASRAAVLDDDVIAIEGKALRCSFAAAAARSPVHLVQAFAAEAALVLGREKVDGKSNETAAMPKLPEMLSLKHRTVAADAMHTRRATAGAVAAPGRDYVLALKANQGSLHDDVRLHLEDPAEGGNLQPCQQVDGDHRRIETRRAAICHDRRIAAGTPWLARPGHLRQERGVRRRTNPHEHRNPLPNHQRPGLAGTLPTRRPLPPGHRRLPPPCARRHHEPGPTAKPQGQRAGKPRHDAALRPRPRSTRTNQGLDARQTQMRLME